MKMRLRICKNEWEKNSITRLKYGVSRLQKEKMEESEITLGLLSSKHTVTECTSDTIAETITKLTKNLLKDCRRSPIAIRDRVYAALSIRDKTMYVNSMIMLFCLFKCQIQCQIRAKVLRYDDVWAKACRTTKEDIEIVKQTAELHGKPLPV